MDIAGFEKIAPHLANPLVLVGFVLMLAYIIRWQLMKSGLLSKVEKKDSSLSLIIRLFIRYGFWLALTLLSAGIGLSAWNSYIEKEKVMSVDAAKLAEKLLAPLEGEMKTKDEQIKALTEAIAALSKADAPAKSINGALQALKQGNTAQAKTIFAEVLKIKEAEGGVAKREAAIAARHLGALAFFNDTEASLSAYKKAVGLDPDNANDWSQLGHLFYRAGKLDMAESSFLKALSLGEKQKNKKIQVIAVGNLGNLYQISDKTEKAGQMYRKAFELNQELAGHAPDLPPEVTWILPERGNSATETNNVLLKAKVASTAKITDLKVLVNGAISATFSQIKTTPTTGFDLFLEYTLPLTVLENELIIYAANSKASASSKPRHVRSDQKPNLYMISIGIKDYRHDKPLQYAAVDAAEISRVFKAQTGGLFKNVEVKDLHNAKATRGDILDALEWLRNSVTQKDIAVVFTAAHGYKENESYYLLPVEGDPKKLRQTAVSWHDYKDILGNLPCKVLLFLDTCHSGQLAENMFSTRGSSPIDNTEAIQELTSAGTGVIIMAASTGSELAHEHPDWGHGAFTKALLEGMEQGKADQSGDRVVQLRELDYYVAERVKDLTKGEQHPKMNFSPGINLFPIIQLQ